MTTVATGDISMGLDAWLRRFNPYLDGILNGEGACAPELVEAVRYSVLAPGKRIRPYLVGACCELCGGTAERALPVAAAMECVHAFSLVHDDLPAMDNDDLRRGRPTNHKVFGEAVAILAGDALLALAFEFLVTRTDSVMDRVALVRELAGATGWAGMIGGQVADILGEGAAPGLDRVRLIHDHKTAALIAASCRMGAIAAAAVPEQVEDLGTYGRHLGRAFQIVDDILDVTATETELGKATTKDLEAGKQTYPRVVGVSGSREAARGEIRLAEAALQRFGAAADNLRRLAQHVLCRRA